MSRTWQQLFEMSTQELLHRLRNPHGLSEDERRKTRLYAANRIEHYREAYQNMLEFAEANGLDPTTRQGEGD